MSGSGWYLVRAYSDRAEMPVLDLYPFASTGPVYVRVGEQPLRSPEDAAFFLRWIDRVEAAALASTGWNTPAERAAVLQAITQARDVFAANR